MKKIKIPPKMEFKIKRNIFLKGMEKILPIPHKNKIHTKKVMIALKSKFSHHALIFVYKYEKNRTNIPLSYFIFSKINFINHI